MCRRFFCCCSSKKEPLPVSTLDKIAKLGTIKLELLKHDQGISRLESPLRMLLLRIKRDLEIDLKDELKDRFDEKSGLVSYARN